MSPAAVPPLMSSDEVNLLVYSYLAESCLDHSAFTLYSESRLGDFLNPSDDNPPSVPPTGHLIRILQKGLLYLQAEARYRGEDIAADPPRLIGYTIPDTLPLPPIPKSLPPPSPPAAVSNSKKRNAHAASPSAAAAAGPSTGIPPTSLKRKESDKHGIVGTSMEGPSEDGLSQTQAKKQRMAARSPTAPGSNFSLSDADSTALPATNLPSQGKHPSPETKDTADEASVSTSKSKKGKGKVADLAVDKELLGENPTSANLSKSASTAGSVNGSDKADAGKRSSAVKTASNPAAVTSHTSTAPGSKMDNGTSTTNHRRSASPALSTRKANAMPNLSKDASRPRSASPNTTLRSVSNSVQTNTSRNGMAHQTPTLDSSRSNTSSLSLASKPAASATIDERATASMPEPKHTVEKNEVITLKGHTLPVQPCHWNPKVETLLATGSGDSTMRIWDVPAQPTGDPVASTVVCKHSSGQRRSDVTAVEWNKDGSLLASGSEDGIARIWTPSGDLHLVLSMHQRTIFCVKWNNTGSMLLTGSLDHSICLWDTGYGKVKQQWSTHIDSILDLDWMTDDIFASCSMDKMINIHQVGRNTPVYRFKGHSDEVNCIRFCPNNRHLASCSDDNTVRVWSLQPVKSLLSLSEKDVQKEGADDTSENTTNVDGRDHPFVVLRGHTKEVHAVAWCPKVTPTSPKLLASASFDGTARLWDALSGSCLYIFSRHTDMVYSLAWRPDGHYLATGSNDKRMCVLRVPSLKSDPNTIEDNIDDTKKEFELVVEYEHPGPIYEICWHPMRNQVAVCGKYESVNVVNVNLSAM